MNSSQEPSVLDYVIARLMPWRGPAPEIPPLEGTIPEMPPLEVSETAAEPRLLAQAPTVVVDSPTQNLDYEVVDRQVEVETPPAAEALPEPASEPGARLPWLSLAAAALALLAQQFMEPGLDRTALPGTVLYLLAAAALGTAVWRKEWAGLIHSRQAPVRDAMRVRPWFMLFGALLSLAAIFFLRGNLFNSANVFFWVMAVAFVCRGLWLDEAGSPAWRERLRAWRANGSWQKAFTGWSLVVLLAAAVVVFFRLYRMQEVPPEMVSDHAEKLLDVWDVLHGETRIFFPRNTGREGLQFYVTAAVIALFNTGYSHLSLKIGTVLAGLLTLPYIYLLGKELGGRRVALLAFFMAGIAYWPNVISRVGLRFPFYPLFVAPTLYYLLRGLRTGRRNDFILAGLALGIGLHGYTPIRILPFVVVAAVGLYLLHREARSSRIQSVVHLMVTALVSLVVFLPLLVFALDNQELFAFRSFSRLGTMERSLPGPILEIFLKNLWRGLTMFAWDDGNIWVVSLTNRPALDIVAGAFFHLGVVYLLVRYLRWRRWQDLFLLLAVPLLQLPSTLSLAFPDENPALNRMGGALVPVFVIAALALDGFMRALERGWRNSGTWAAWTVTGALLVFSASQNYDLVFRQYQDVYRQSAWNTSEMGQVIGDFARRVGHPDTAYVVAFPHWVDTRLVGINAGFPLIDFAIWPENIPATQADVRPKLFLVRPDDEQGLATLHSVYPQGVEQPYTSQVPGHNFTMYYVFP